MARCRTDVDAAMREVRRALIEADVALEVVRSFTDQVRQRAIGQEVIRSIKPGQMVVKIVHDAMVDTLGREAVPLDLKAAAPVTMLMVGLQDRTDHARPWCQAPQGARAQAGAHGLARHLAAGGPEQLAILEGQVGVDTLAIVKGEKAVDITRRALAEARRGGFDVLMLDTAGRQHIDEALMREVVEVRDIAKPHETLLVADSLTGQDAVNLARSFDERVEVSGIVLTRVDVVARRRGAGNAGGDRQADQAHRHRRAAGRSRGFHPERIAGRILGMGGVVSLVEKAALEIDAEKARKIAARMKKGAFDLDDLPNS